MPNFEVLNDSNVLQIGSDYTNLALSGKFNVSPVSRPRRGRPDGGEFAVSVRGTNPIIAFTGNNNAALLNREQSGDTFTFRGMTDGVNPFTAYTFDYPGVIGPGQYLEIYREDGSIGFTATHKYMRVVGMMNADISQTGVHSVDVGGGRQVAAVAGVNGGTLRVDGGIIGGAGSSWRTMTSSQRVVTNTSGSVVTAANRQFLVVQNDGNNGVPYPTPGIFGRAVVFTPLIDVTGY